MHIQATNINIETSTYPWHFLSFGITKNRSYQNCNIDNTSWESRSTHSLWHILGFRINNIHTELRSSTCHRQISVSTSSSDATRNASASFQEIVLQSSQSWFSTALGQQLVSVSRTQKCSKTFQINQVEWEDLVASNRCFWLHKSTKTRNPFKQN